jgi:hypothetical protein
MYYYEDPILKGEGLKEENMYGCLENYCYKFHRISNYRMAMF